MPYPGAWPSLQPLRIVVEKGPVLDASVNGNVVRVALPPGEQVRLALSSTLDPDKLSKFGLWRSHLASVANPADGFTPDEVVASAALRRAAADGWLWWLSPATQVRLVHAVPVPVRAPVLSGLSVFLRPPGKGVVSLTVLVDVHGPSTVELQVKATWNEQLDDPATPGPTTLAKSDVVVRSAVGERQRTRVLFLFDYQPTGAMAARFGGVGFHKLVQTFEDTRHRVVSYVPAGTTRYAEYFSPSEVPPDGTVGEPVVLDIPSSARPAAPVVVEAVPLLLWDQGPEPLDPFAFRQVRRSGVRVWLKRPWFSSGDGELLGVLVFDRDEWTEDPAGSGQWRRSPKATQAPDGATSLWAADPIAWRGARVSTPTVPPLLSSDHLLLDTWETAVSEAVKISPPLGGQVPGGRDRGWPKASGQPVAVAAAVPLRDVAGQPAVRVLGYQPEFDEASGQWFVDVAVNESPALWPFLRLALARYQPDSIDGCSLSPVALTGWVQPLPARTLTIGRPEADGVQVTLTGVVNWLRFSDSVTELPGDLLSADAPTGEAASRAARLLQTRAVQATIQRLPSGAGDLEWESVTTVGLAAVSVQESGGCLATWTGSLRLPPAAQGVAAPEFRRPGADGSSWRVLVEEHELLKADPTPGQPDGSLVPRLVYAGEVSL